jgi:hypothetical protein
MSFLLEAMEDKFRFGTRLFVRNGVLMRLSVGARWAGFVDADGRSAPRLEDGEEKEGSKDDNPAR